MTVLVERHEGRPRRADHDLGDAGIDRDSVQSEPLREAAPQQPGSHPGDRTGAGEDDTGLSAFEPFGNAVEGRVDPGRERTERLDVVGIVVTGRPPCGSPLEQPLEGARIRLRPRIVLTARSQ